MNETRNISQVTPQQQWGLILLRIIIGWHFLYEGVVKLMDPAWSTESYLLSVRGPLSRVFAAMAAQPSVLAAVDFLNVWGLILIGLGLFLGFFARAAVYSGIFLLFFYYIAYPPFQSHSLGIPQEGHYLIFNKTFIELVALGVLALFPQTLNIGLWSLLKKLKFRIHFTFPHKNQKVQPSTLIAGRPESRRNMLKHLTFLPFIGGFVVAFINNKKHTDPDAFSGSTFTVNQNSRSAAIEGEMPTGVLVKGKKPISRLILGTNIFSGTAHARDLVYARSLFKAYNSEKKILDTYLLAEKSGINLAYMTPLLIQYKKIFGSNLQTWSNVSPTKEDIYSQVDRAIDQGVDYIFVQGAACDRRVFDGEVDVVVKCVDYIKQQGYPAGLGAHTIQAMLACVEAGADPDFYYKTMHHDRYWSAHPKEYRYPFLWSSNISEDHNKFHDNMWCLFPEQTIEFVQNVKKPVVGFKVLAGGAIDPKEGFQWAFDNGADFIEVGMFDFQIIEDVNLTITSVEKAKNRSRPWYG